MAARAKRLIPVAAVACAWAAVLAAQQAPARRIISLVPALTEALYAIGAGPSVVAVSSYDDYPPEVKTLPRVGALLDPDTERILSMRPDLVLAYGTQDALKAQLQRTGIPVFDYRHGGIADITATIRRLGVETGHVSGANRVVLEIERRIAEVRARVAERPRPRVLLVFGREPLSLRNVYASGGQGFLHDLIDAAGGTNVFGDVRRESVQVSTEMLLSRAPEAIIELRVGAPPAGEQARREREAWQRLPGVPAVRSQRVFILHGDHLLVPGPRVALAAEDVARALHPEVFR